MKRSQSFFGGLIRNCVVLSDQVWTHFGLSIRLTLDRSDIYWIRLRLKKLDSDVYWISFRLLRNLSCLNSDVVQTMLDALKIKYLKKLDVSQIEVRQTADTGKTILRPLQ